jgi:hypothetical protein
MPRYEVTGPDGRKFEIDAPNKEALSAAVTQMFGAPQVAPQEAAQEPVQPSIGNRLNRQLGLTGRAMIEGITDIPAMVGDAANALVNVGITGVNRAAGTDMRTIPPLSGEIQRGLKAIGVPEPETGSERVVNFIGRSAASAPIFPAVAQAVGSKALEPLTRNVGAQAAAAAGTGGGVGIAREIDPENIALQIAAGLAGGLAGGRTAGVSPQRAATAEAFERSGIAPSVADVSGSPTLQRAQKVAEALPGSSGYVRAQEQARLGQAAERAGEIVEGYGTPRSPTTMGETVQNRIGEFRSGRPNQPPMTESEILRSPTRVSSIAEKANAIYGRVPIAPDTEVAMPATQAALRSSRFQNPELAEAMADPTMKRWADILERASGNLSWNDLRNLRTEVRYLKGQPELMAKVDKRVLGELEGALTEDMKAGAKAVGGDSALRAVERADNYYRLAASRIDSGLKQIYNATTPEAAYAQIERAMSASPTKGDITKLQTLRKVLTPDDWGDVSATVIDRLGRRNPGQVDVGPDFSVNTFMTRYSAMSPEARNALFAGNSEMKSALDSFTKALGAMKNTERLANVSQSGNQAIGAMTGGAFMAAPVSTSAGLLLANMGARALYSPAFVKLATRTLNATSPEAKAAVGRDVSRFVSQNPSLAEEANNLLRLVQPRAEGTE